MMNEKIKKTEITPFKLLILLEIAAKVVKMMTVSTWHLTFDEMDIVMGFIRQGIEEARRQNEEVREEDLCSVRQEN